jgi:Fe-S oxidoreductase
MTNLRDYLYTMESCNSCGQCRFILGPKTKGSDFVEICPIYTHFLFESYSGQGMINMAQELLEGSLHYDKGLVDHVYSCMTCGACDINCKSVRDMEVMDTILALRAKCVEDGWGPMPAHKKRCESILKFHNPFEEPHDQRQDWLPDDIPLDDSVETAYFAGCSSSYRQQDIARHTVSILRAGNMPFKLLSKDEFCCGGPLWRTGQHKEASDQAKHHLEIFKKMGITTLIVSCAECYGTFRGFYPRIAGLPFEVKHISEVTQNMLQEGRLKLRQRIPIKATYHDPCLLGRLSETYVPWEGEILAYGYHEPPKKFRRGIHGLYDAPRDILNAIPDLELIEMTRNAENAFCCGGGGGVPEAFPDLSLQTAAERLREAASIGADSIVSCCPFCRSSFESAITETNSEIKYFDLTDLVARSIE